MQLFTTGTEEPKRDRLRSSSTRHTGKSRLTPDQMYQESGTFPFLCCLIPHQWEIHVRRVDANPGKIYVHSVFQSQFWED